MSGAPSPPALIGGFPISKRSPSNLTDQREHPSDPLNKTVRLFGGLPSPKRANRARVSLGLLREALVRTSPRAWPARWARCRRCLACPACLGCLVFLACLGCQLLQARLGRRRGLGRNGRGLGCGGTGSWGVELLVNGKGKGFGSGV